MLKTENPYQVIVEIMDKRRNQAQRATYRLCRVLSVSPVVLEVAGTRQSGNIKCNSALLAGEKRTVDTGGGAALMELKAVSAALKPGDTVLTLSEDDQEFIIICKVVSA